MAKTISKNKSRIIRKRRSSTKNIKGINSKPRMCVFKSNTNIYVQFIDDEIGKTLFSVSSLKMKETLNLNTSKEVGKLAGQKAKENGIKEVLFDRNGNLYHGNIKGLADAARKEGLKF